MNTMNCLAKYVYSYDCVLSNLKKHSAFCYKCFLITIYIYNMNKFHERYIQSENIEIIYIYI